MVIVPVFAAQAASVVVTATAVAPPVLAMTASGALKIHPLTSFTAMV